MTGFLEIDDLEKNFERCRQYTRHYAKTFYFASHVLPKAKRRAAYAIYAFCRYADEIADGQNLPAAHSLRRWEDLHEQLRRVYSGSPHMDPRLRAFRDTVQRYNIPQSYFLDLLRGIRMDLDRKHFRTFAELTDYCYCVASTVGLMMTHIFGAADKQALTYARDLGIAMQLTNILRDVGEDYQRGRVYLPLDEFAHFGYSLDELARGVRNESFRSMMDYNIRRARAYYARADRGIPLLTNDGSRFCVRLMRRTYATILNEIERNDYDVFTRRAFVPRWKKLTIAVGALLKGERVSDQMIPDDTHDIVQNTLGLNGELP